MGANSVEDVLRLVEAMGGAKQVQEPAEGVMPDPDLVSPWAPDFEPNVTAKTVAGSFISLEDIERAWASGENIHLVGPSGAGKTTLAYGILDRMNEAIRAENRILRDKNLAAAKAGSNRFEEYKPLPYPVSHYSAHRGSRSEELLGSVTIQIDGEGNRRPVEVPGAALDAWEGGKTFLFEEFDLAPPGVLGELHLLLDGTSRQYTSYVNGPRKVHKHKEFRCIATSNTHGAGENAMEFADTQPMNAAFMNRFNYTVIVTWLSEQAESSILQKKTNIHGPNSEKMILIANKVRDNYAQGLISRPISTRNLLAWAREIQRQKEKFSKSVLAGMDRNEQWKLIGVPSAIPTVINCLSEAEEQQALYQLIKSF
jgi:MoxR-like ATPase